MRKIRNAPLNSTLTLLLTLTICSIASGLMVFSSTAFSQDASTLIKKNQVSSSNTNATQDNIPSAESVYQNQSMVLPPSVKLFVWYIVNEAHEDSSTEHHKYVSDHNPHIPSNQHCHSTGNCNILFGCRCAMGHPSSSRHQYCG